MIRHNGRRRSVGPFGGSSLSAAVGIGLALLLIGVADHRFRPLLQELAQVKIQQTVTVLLQQAATETPLPYDQVIHVERDGEGRVALLTSDMSAIQAYRAEVVERIAALSREPQLRRIKLPLGALLGSPLLSSLGPGLPVRLLSMGVAQAELYNSFTSAGINQTRHQILLDITVDVRYLLAGHSEHCQSSTQICVADTVIVGAVPEQFTSINRIDSAE